MCIRDRPTGLLSRLFYSIQKSRKWSKLVQMVKKRDSPWPDIEILGWGTFSPMIPPPIVSPQIYPLWVISNVAVRISVHTYTRCLVGYTSSERYYFFNTLLLYYLQNVLFDWNLVGISYGLERVNWHMSWRLHISFLTNLLGCSSSPTL